VSSTGPRRGGTKGLRDQDATRPAVSHEALPDIACRERANVERYVARAPHAHESLRNSTPHPAAWAATRIARPFHSRSRAESRLWIESPMKSMLRARPYSAIHPLSTAWAQLG